MTDAVASNGAVQMPPLYGRLEPLTLEAHRELRIRDAGFGFAAGLTAVPLAAEEFISAARHLPIVFADQAPHMPVALTALRPGTSLFVEDGAWREGAYVPAYLRRFPFFLVRVREGSEELALCLDPAAPQVATDSGNPLFEAGQPTEAARRAFEFTRAVEGAFVKTREMVTRLGELGLLAPAKAEVQQNGRPLRLDGFHAVQREALGRLSPEDLAALRDKGWLDCIYAHLFSMGAIPELAARTA
ncbi:SapC family protein [Roseococcus sp. DSY-14]|uniref:SapC family protein n=1 Tax=Roseococcus sp. DSY-14 TaxID=3369650 RepID=UPI00387B44DB